MMLIFAQMRDVNRFLLDKLNVGIAPRYKVSALEDRLQPKEWYDCGTILEKDCAMAYMLPEKVLPCIMKQISEVLESAGCLSKSSLIPEGEVWEKFDGLSSVGKYRLIVDK